MSDETELSSRPQSAPKIWLRRHFVLYGVVIGALTVANLMSGAPWWAFWPTAIWGLVLMLHFFLYRSMNVDERWVEERVGDLRMRSYDLSHITDIEDRVERRDASVRTAEERNPRGDSG